MPVGAISSNDPRAIVQAGNRAAESGQNTASLPPAPPPPPSAPPALPPDPSSHSGNAPKWYEPGGSFPPGPATPGAGHPIGPVLSPVGSGSDSGVTTVKPSNGPAAQAIAQELDAPKPGQVTPTAAGANAVLDNSSYSSGNNLNIWNGVTGIDPGNNETGMKQELNRPIAAAQELSANWKNWGLDKNISFSNPPATLPPEAQAVIKYVAANPALATELGYAGTTGKSTDITEAKVDAFIKQATSDAGNASKTVQDWMKKNPGASDQTKALVQSAAVMMANQALAVSSDTGHQNGTTGNDGLMTAPGLSQLGAQNPGLSQTLGDAAKLWGQPGMFKYLDTAGKDIATTAPDGKADTQNLGNWISKEAPTTDVDAANLLNQAAVENTVAGIDTSKLGTDVFANPQNYTGAQKAAVMVQLGDLSAETQAASDDGSFSTAFGQGKLNSAGIASDPQAVQNDLSQKIQQLQQDPSVQAYLNQTLPGAQQTVLNSDGRVQTAFQNYFTSSIQTGGALNDDLKGKDSKGNPVTPAAAMQSFTQQTTFYDGALGSGGKTLGLLDQSNGPSQLNKFVQASGQEANLQSYYTDNIENTKMLTDSVSSGTDMATAMTQFSAAAASFATGLDPAFIGNNAAQTQQNFITNSTGSLLDNASTAEINNAFNDQTGDETQTNAIVQQLQKNDPSMFTASDGTQVPVPQIVNLVKQSTDLIRQGVKAQDALAKVFDSISSPSGPVTDAYKSGALHIVSALLAGGVLAAKKAEGTSNPNADVGIAAAAAQTVGTFTEGVGKFGGEASKQLLSGADLASSAAMFKNLENGGKVLGNLGSAIGGAASVVSGIGDIKAGDTALGGIDIGTGAVRIGTGVAGATEGGAGLLSTAGLISGDVAGGIAAGSSAVGLAGTAIGVLGGLGYLIAQTVQAGKDTNTTVNMLAPALTQFGATGGEASSPDGSGSEATAPPPPPPVTAASPGGPS